jgi:hypothetical protein
LNRVCSIFSQILQLISRSAFAEAVEKHKAERHARVQQLGPVRGYAVLPVERNQILARGGGRLGGERRQTAAFRVALLPLARKTLSHSEISIGWVCCADPVHCSLDLADLLRCPCLDSQRLLAALFDFCPSSLHQLGHSLPCSRRKSPSRFRRC